MNKSVNAKDQLVEKANEGEFLVSWLCFNSRNSQIFKLIPCDLNFKDPWKEKKVCNDNNYLYEVKMKEKL